MLLMVTLSGQLYGQTTFIKHYSTKDGLPSNNCYFTLQDKSGYIWVGTDAGVTRFDGKVFETFSIDDGLPDNQIIRLNQDRSGKVWFTALNGQLSYFHNGRIYSQHNNKLLKLLNLNSIIVSFFEDSKGNIWFGTNKNLLVKWDGKSVTKYSSDKQSSQFINTFVYEDKKGRIWASSVHCLHLYDGQKFVQVKNHIDPVSYKTAVNLPDHTMLYLDRKGLNLKDGERESLILKVDPILLNDNPGYFYAGKKGDLWLANNSGVYYINHQGILERYLTDQMTSQVIKDQKDNMWFTTNNGIYMLPRKSKRVYIVDDHHGLSNNGVKSLTKDSRGRIWLGMDNGTIDRLNKPGYTVDHLDLPDKNKFNTIKHLSFDSSGSHLFFSSDYGLGKISVEGPLTGKIDYLNETNNFRYVLKSFSISKNNQLALALSSGVVIINDPLGSLSFNSSLYREGKNYFSGRSYSVHFDKDKKLWFSNIHGLSKFSNDKLSTCFQQNYLLTKRINDIAQLPDGTTVLATDGYGLLLFRKNKLIRQITRKDGLSSNICKKLYIEKDYVWVITNAAVNRIFVKEKFPVESFEYTNSMLDNDVNELYIDADTAYFATNHGLVFFKNTPFNNNQEPPAVLISAIVNNKKSLNINTSLLNLAPRDNNITFYYSAIDFQNSAISYRYRLIANDSWTETKNRRLEFSSLEPGKYTFELSARTSNSQWSKPVKQTFVLKEHFWQSIWFLCLLILIISFSFYKIAVIVTKQQKDKEQQRLLLKNKILMLEQQALQAMMNPHFVFNVMNSIQHYINTKDTSSANKILTGFARLIRKNLDICTKSFISLEEEIEYLTLYLTLEKKRFGEKFDYSLQVAGDIDLDETMIPSMILQPYVENAIWHGLMPKEEGGKIDINIQMAGDGYLQIQIADDGVGIDNSLRTKTEKHESKGMSLTQERVNLINQIEVKPIQITIQQRGDSGTIISILVPNR